MFRVPYFAPCSYRLCKATHICEDFVQALKLFEKSSHCLQLAHTSKQAWLLKQCSLVGAAHVAHCAKVVYGTRVAPLPAADQFMAEAHSTSYLETNLALDCTTGCRLRTAVCCTATLARKTAQVACPRCLGTNLANVAFMLAAHAAHTHMRERGRAMWLLIVAWPQPPFRHWHSIYAVAFTVLLIQPYRMCKKA